VHIMHLSVGWETSCSSMNSSRWSVPGRSASNRYCRLHADSKLASGWRQFTDFVGSWRSNQLYVSKITCPTIQSGHGYVPTNAIFIFSYGPRTEITLWAVKERTGLLDVQIVRLPCTLPLSHNSPSWKTISDGHKVCT